MKKVNFLCLILLGLFFSACHSNDDTWGDWSKSYEFSGTGRTHAVRFKIVDEANNKEYVYVGLGYNYSISEKDKNLRDFWRFDGHTWTRVDSFPALGRMGSVAFVVGTTAYVGGGYRAAMTNLEKDTYYTDFYKFDGLTGKWIEPEGAGHITNYPGSGFYDGVGFSLNQLGYVGTGRLDGKDSKEIYSYNPATGEWKDAGFLGESRVAPVTFQIGSKVVLCLGSSQGSSSEYKRDVWVFDGNTWSSKAPLRNLSDQKFDDDYENIPRVYAVAFTSNRDGGVAKGYVAGGIGPNAKSCWEYNIETDRWYEVTGFPAAMGSARVSAVGFSLNDYGYITVGGANAASNNPTYDNSTWKFTPGIDEDDKNDYAPQD